jgi:thioredoxin-like negative regulator of GroEL
MDETPQNNADGAPPRPAPMAAPSAVAAPTPWRQSLDDALLIARASQRPVLLVVIAPWSDWSRRLLRETIPNAASALLEGFVRVVVNGDADPQLVADRHIEVYPTTLVLDGNGQEIARVTGFRTVPEWSQALWPVVAGTR